VAGVGFLTDSYDVSKSFSKANCTSVASPLIISFTQIFAVNMVLPMLEIVYWQNSLPAHQQTAINLATLVGTIIGQLTFGILADRYGRKRMYGYELIIVIVATVGLALCSKGAQSSVNILAWVISWRLLMGIGIGADYPLSAVIVSEYVVIGTLWLSPPDMTDLLLVADSRQENTGLVCLQQSSSCNRSASC
jgi:MFS family permease